MLAFALVWSLAPGCIGVVGDVDVGNGVGNCGVGLSFGVSAGFGVGAVVLVLVVLVSVLVLDVDGRLTVCAARYAIPMLSFSCKYRYHVHVFSFLGLPFHPGLTLLLLAKISHSLNSK